MNPPTTTALRAETQLETTPIQRPIQAVPQLPYNEIIRGNIDLLEDSLPEVLAGYSPDNYHLVREFGKVVSKHPVAVVTASISRAGQIQEVAADSNELSISRYRTDLTVMRKKPIIAPEETSLQMRAPYEIIDFGDFYQTAGSLALKNVMNALHRYNGDRKERHETQIC